MGNPGFNSRKRKKSKNPLSLQISLWKKVLTTASSLGKKPGLKEPAEIYCWAVGNLLLGSWKGRQHFRVPVPLTKSPVGIQSILHLYLDVL